MPVVGGHFKFAIHRSLSFKFIQQPGAWYWISDLDHLTISIGGNINLQNGVEGQCFNYSLALPFQSKPRIAIGVNHLESGFSNDLFFSIRSVNSDSLGSLQFLIRTQWKYTQWMKISFAFVAEDTFGYEAGYFNIGNKWINVFRHWEPDWMQQHQDCASLIALLYTELQSSQGHYLLEWILNQLH